MNKRTLGVIGIFLIGIALGVAASSLSPVTFNSNKVASSKLENLYELVNPGLDVTAVKVDQVSGMYKVLFKAVDPAGGVTYREAYITTDGKLLTENVIVVDQSITQLTKVHNFVDCLQGKKVMIAGLSNQTETLIQLNVLGGSYATKLYLRCDDALAQQCVDAGITQVPSVIYNSNVYPGFQSLQFIENLTSCKA